MATVPCSTHRDISMPLLSCVLVVLQALLPSREASPAVVAQLSAGAATAPSQGAAGNGGDSAGASCCFSMRAS
ncbi:hypothetical protein BDA96_01G283000 [Sorghum bicolor]|uniref:Secreted protein n=1 Tax=Sorghum bicolor TaxID=4558 RepID=A0A921S1M1_SORBI|nr:hypothetical protein BDA96_01G283000 [Sorghum bicolor]